MSAPADAGATRRSKRHDGGSPKRSRVQSLNLHNSGTSRESGLSVGPTSRRSVESTSEPAREAKLGESNLGFVNNRIVTSKYTVLSFLPRSLLEQFRRLANIYFLLISILMMIGTYVPSLFASPLTPFSTLGPLVLVLAITMVKEALEDWKRHKSDHEVNTRRASVLRRSGRVEQVPWVDIHVGDLVKVENMCEVPADMVVVWSSSPDGQCYIETSNIDGETNLKIRDALPTVFRACERGWDQLADIRGTMTYEPPNASIHTFEGRLRWCPNHRCSFETAAVSARNVLLRGCTLRNTASVWGVVAYTGEETKVMKKAGGARSKLSQIEHLVNKCIRIIFLTQFTLCTISTVFLIFWDNAHDGELPYLRLKASSTVLPTWLGSWFTFLILYNNFIPISLVVTMEMINYLQGYFIDNDVDMYDVVSEVPAKARTSNLAEDLGQIEYVFSDKTGTLTQNIMEFRMASIGGRVFGSMTPTSSPQGPSSSSAVSPTKFHDAAIARALDDPSHPQFQAVSNFFTCLAVCHTVVVDRADMTSSDYSPPVMPTKMLESLVYQAESPDEGALTQAARDVGFVYLGRTSTTLRILVPSTKNPVEYQFYGVHEFNSDRKRMSVVVRTPDGRVMLYTKGADNVIFKRLKPDIDVTKLNKHLTKFACEGLRTLVVAEREMSENEFRQWRQEFSAASEQVNGRAQALSRVAEKYEKGLDVLGATAIEDKLQDGVPGTIADLARAGIKTWVLTGDKVETAINIGHSCRLLNSGMDIIKITSGRRSEVTSQLTRLSETFSPLTADPVSFVRRLFRSVSLSGSRSQQRRKNNNGGNRSARKGRAQRDNAGATIVDNPLPPTRARSIREADTTRTRAQTLQVPASGPVRVNIDALAVVVTGDALRHILGRSVEEARFLSVAQMCRSVIACRVSPSQKADLVRLVRRSAKPKPMCLAIGDGANDVNMIQAAQVGVGISGREGQQAVNASDFAIAQFRFLRRLLLVHGRWSYIRMSKAVLYSFYKNIVLTLTLFFYTFSTGFSGTSLYESLVYAGFNFFLGLPIFCVGVLERDISEKSCLAHPIVYASGRDNMLLNVRKMAQWIAHAILHAVLIYFIPFFAWRWAGSWKSDGKEDGLYSFGVVVYTGLILSMHWQLVMVESTWTWINHFVLWLSIVGYFGFIVVYSMFSSYVPVFFGVTLQILSSVEAWLVIALVVVACIVADLTIESIRRQWFPTEIDIAQEIDMGLSKQGWQDPHDAEPPLQFGFVATPIVEDDASSPLTRRSTAGEAETKASAAPTPSLSSPGARARARRRSMPASQVRQASVASDTSAGVRPSATRRGSYSVTREGLNRMMHGMSRAERGELGFASHTRTGFAYSGSSSTFGPGGGRNGGSQLTPSQE